MVYVSILGLWFVWFEIMRNFFNGKNDFLCCLGMM